MDYKYIEQLLERYWECQTSLEEEEILRAFFIQEDVPASLLQYRDLFVYEHSEVANDVLGEEFDDKILAHIGKDKHVKARMVSFTQRLRPLFKAVAIVAIILTLSNAIQMSFDDRGMTEGMNGASMSGQTMAGVDQTDSTDVDSLRRTSLAPKELNNMNQLEKQTFSVK